MNENTCIDLFYMLKEAVTQKHLSKHLNCGRKMTNWIQEDIYNFQEDLSSELQERISERWFYTHLKPLENKKLPRIDMLNMLCKYIGYAGWNEFVLKNEGKLEQNLKQDANKLDSPLPKRWIYISLATIVSITIIGFIFFWNKELKPLKYTFCFYNKDIDLPITDEKIDVIFINENESDFKTVSNEHGCISIESDKDYVKFIVKAKYFKTDTIERFLKGKPMTEIVELARDDYALMILYFATSGIENWEKRRKQLNEMIDDKAIIFQITRDYTGMEMYNKKEFIDKLTTPLESLGDIEIIETIYANNKIMNIRFIQN